VEAAWAGRGCLRCSNRNHRAPHHPKRDLQRECRRAACAAIEPILRACDGKVGLVNGIKARAMPTRTRWTSRPRCGFDRIIAVHPRRVWRTTRRTRLYYGLPTKGLAVCHRAHTRPGISGGRLGRSKHYVKFTEVAAALLEEIVRRRTVVLVQASHFVTAPGDDQGAAARCAGAI